MYVWMPGVPAVRTASADPSVTRICQSGVAVPTIQARARTVTSSVPSASISTRTSAPSGTSPIRRRSCRITVWVSFAS